MTEELLLLRTFLEEDEFKATEPAEVTELLDVPLLLSANFSTTVSNAETSPEPPHFSMFLPTFANSPFLSAVAAHSAISVFVLSSSHEPSFAMSVATSFTRSTSFATFKSDCIITLTASNAALSLPDSRMFKSSDNANSPSFAFTLNAASTSFSACFFASAKDIFSSVTRFMTRLYSSSVSILMFTFLRSLRSVNAWSVTSLADFIPVNSSRYFPVTSNKAHVAERFTYSTPKSPLSLLTTPSKISFVSSIVLQSIPCTVTADPLTNGPFCVSPATFKSAMIPVSSVVPPAKPPSSLDDVQAVTQNEAIAKAIA